MSSNLQVIFTNKDDIQQCEVKYEDIPSTLNESRFKNQVLAILIGITGSMQYGFTISFTATFLPQITEYDNITTLENTESALNINTETGSWLASCVVLSIMIGLTTASLLVQRYKRKFLLIISNFPWLMGWILLTIAYNVSFIITGCICVGLSAGFNKAIVQIYLVEITEPRLCKTLLSFVLSGISAGILVSHVIGILLHWKTVYLIFFFISTVSLILSFFIRETPYWLVFNGELTKARDNFFNLREVTTKNVNEFNKLLDKEWQNIRKSRRIVPENVLSKKFAKIILLLFLIHTVLTGSGYNIMSYYTIYVLRGISQSLNIKTSLILLDTVSICSSLISYYALELTNRKTLFLISSLGCFRTPTGFQRDIIRDIPRIYESYWKQYHRNIYGSLTISGCENEPVYDAKFWRTVRVRYLKKYVGYVRMKENLKYQCARCQVVIIQQMKYMKTYGCCETIYKCLMIQGILKKTFVTVLDEGVLTEDAAGKDTRCFATSQ
ncbi:hypothetical protein PGB90_007001 [Kerria lacca]